MRSRSIMVLGLTLVAIASQCLFVNSAFGQALQLRVVTQDGTAMRAGDMPRFYRVAELNAGTVVEVIGESNGWAKVVYPKGIDAYVEADRVEKVNDKTLRLTRESALLAPSELLGASGSWCALFESPLPVGTELELKEEIAGIGGKVSKYLVTTPRKPQVTTQARGFVLSTSLRDATEAEAARYLASTGAPMPRPVDQPVDTPVTPIPGNQAERPVTQPQVPAPNPTPQTSVDPVDTSLLSPINTDPLPPVVRQPETAQPSDQTNAPLGTNAQPTEPATQQEMIALTINQLNASFDQLRAMPRDKMDAGLEEMLAECRRSAAALSNEPSLVAGINQRIAWLELRIKLRDQRLELERALADADKRQAELATRVKAWQDQRSYTLIGRLLPSTLYDGNRLPLMYRIEAIEGPGLQRTVGYIVPGATDDLKRHTGAVVGVIGSTRFDQALGVRIVTPSRVDFLETP